MWTNCIVLNAKPNCTYTKHQASEFKQVFYKIKSWVAHVFTESSAILVREEKRDAVEEMGLGETSVLGWETVTEVTVILRMPCFIHLVIIYV